MEIQFYNEEHRRRWLANEKAIQEQERKEFRAWGRKKENREQYSLIMAIKKVYRKEFKNLIPVSDFSPSKIVKFGKKP